MKVGNLPGKMVGLALVILGALLILLYYYQAAGGRLPLAEDRYTVTAVVEPQQLLKHADVRSAGVTVGEVVGVESLGNLSKVTMDLEKDVVPVFADAKIAVRQKTLVGENYIDLRRGSPRAGELPDGSALPREATQEVVPIDRILNSLDKRTRAAIKRNLRALGDGWNGAGQDFNRVAESLRPLTTDGVQVTDILNAQRKQVADIIEDGAVVFDAVADRRRDLSLLISSANTTARAVAARDEQLKAAFNEFPGTLRQARGTVQRLSGFSSRAVPVLTDLRHALTDLRPVVRDLQPTARATNTLLSELPRFAREADPLLKELRSFSKVAGPALPALDAVLRQANPAFAYLAPYNKDLTHMLSVFGGNGFYDKYGAIGRCSCPVGDRSFANWTPALKQAANLLLESGILNTVQSTKNDHYRKPGSITGFGDYDGRKYPHIEADPAAGK